MRKNKKSLKQVSRVIRQKAASPTCHASRLRNDSFDLDPHLCMVPLTHVTHPSNGISIGSANFVQLIGVPKHTDIQTTLRATSVAIGRVYAMHAVRPSILFKQHDKSSPNSFAQYEITPYNMEIVSGL